MAAGAQACATWDPQRRSASGTRCCARWRSTCRALCPAVPPPWPRSTSRSGGTRVLYLDRLSGQRSVPVVSRTGSRLALHATGVGKVLLAYAPGDVQYQILSSLRRITPYTITQPERLRAQLSQVRADGYATTAEEMTLGACSAAVPIRRGYAVVAALGIVVPSLRQDKARLVSALQVAAHGIGRSLGPIPGPQETPRSVRDH